MICQIILHFLCACLYGIYVHVHLPVCILLHKYYSTDANWNTTELPMFALFRAISSVIMLVLHVPCRRILCRAMLQYFAISLKSKTLWLIVGKNIVVASDFVALIMTVVSAYSILHSSDHFRTYSNSKFLFRFINKYALNSIRMVELDMASNWPVTNDPYILENSGVGTLQSISLGIVSSVFNVYVWTYVPLRQIWLAFTLI